MSEQQKILKEVTKAISLNIGNLQAAKVNAIMCEVNIKTYQKRLLKMDEIHKEKINSVQKQINRYIDNLKTMNKTLDDLLAEKEALHIELTEATHYGKEQCEYCLNYFTPSGIARHKNACASKPSNRAVKKHKTEIEVIVDEIEARKAVLEKELAALKKAKPKPKPKPKPVKVIEPEWPEDNGTTTTSGEDTEITDK